MSACRLHIPDCWDPWQLYQYSVSVPLFLVTKELFCGLPGVRQPQTKLPTSCPLLLLRSYRECRLIRQRGNVESSEQALKPGCPIFAETEKRYYPYSLGVPVDPMPTSLFLCQFQQQLPSVLIIYTCTSFWLKLLATWEGRKRSTIFSPLFFSFEKLEGMHGAPYSHENLLGCGLQSDVLELASLFSQIPQWYILVVENQFQFPLRSLPLVCWNERATPTLVVVDHYSLGLIVCDHMNCSVSPYAVWSYVFRSKGRSTG